MPTRIDIPLREYHNSGKQNGTVELQRLEAPKLKPCTTGVASANGVAAFENNATGQSSNEEPSMAVIATSKKRSYTDFADQKSEEPSAKSSASETKRKSLNHENNMKSRCENYRGVNWRKSDSKFVAQVWIKADKKQRLLGSYLLASDSAYVVDRVNEALGGTESVAPIFHSVAEYHVARDSEMKEARLSIDDVGTVESLCTEIDEIIARISQDIRNNGSLAKCTSPVPAEKKTHQKQCKVPGRNELKQPDEESRVMDWSEEGVVSVSKMKAKSGPSSSNLAIPLSMPNDLEIFSPRFCYIRKNCLEFFEATSIDTEQSRGRRSHIDVGRVGIRCVYCKHCPITERASQSTAFPSTLSKIYSSVVMWQSRHASKCHQIPVSVNTEFADMKSSKYTGGDSVEIWAESAMKKGLVDTASGIKFAHPSHKVASSRAVERSSQLSGKESSATAACDESDKVESADTVCELIENRLKQIALDHTVARVERSGQTKTVIRSIRSKRGQGGQSRIELNTSSQIPREQTVGSVERSGQTKTATRSRQSGIESDTSSMIECPVIQTSKSRKSSTSDMDASKSAGVKRTSNFFGVCYHKNKKKFEAKVTSGGKGYYVGCYVLETDAAMGRDSALAALKIKDLLRNFGSFAAYKAARQKELLSLKNSGACTDSIESLEEVSKRIQQNVTTKCEVALFKLEKTAFTELSGYFDALLLRDYEGVRANDEKHTRQNQNTTAAATAAVGKEVAVIDGQKNWSITPDGFCRTDEVSKVVPESDPKPIAASPRDQHSNTSNKEACEAPIDGQVEEVVELSAPAPTNPITDSFSPSNVSGLILLSVNQTNNLPYTIGCSVMFELDFESDDFIQGGKVGKVTSAYIDPNSSEVMYGVQYDGQAKIALLGKNSLAYVVGTSIKYSHTGSFDSGNYLLGKVIMCRTEATSKSLPESETPQVVYTIMTFGPNRTNGEFEVVKDVTLDQLQFSSDA
ncbi:hypothetical protein ACHAWO_004230 [Cyclotella atomus]|uniref:Uncharacterized protein n=1 Tax=Cyclotella atomus TaxID=382360 RepID=A0ABD3PZT7_9STRA